MTTTEVATASRWIAEETSTVVMTTMLQPFMNDSTGNDTEDDSDLGDGGGEAVFGPLQIIAVAMFAVIAAGLVGNGAVLYIVIRHKDMHTTTNFSFANLALTDFLFLICHALPTSFDNIGFKLSLALNCWPTIYLRYVVGEVTCLTLALMSYDRYRMVAHPLDSLRHTKRRKNGILVCIVLIWLISLGIFTPLLIYTVNFYGIYCTIIIPWIHGQKVFHTSAAIVMYVIPLSFIVICYLLIFLRLRKPNPGEVGNDRGQRSRRMRRTLRLILIVVVVFAVSWLLEHSIIVWLVWDPNFLPNSALFRTTTAITKVILYVNSAVNPFMYPFAGTGFTKHLWCGKRRGLGRSSTTMTESRFSNGSTMKLSVVQSTVSTSAQSLDSINVSVQTSVSQN